MPPSPTASAARHLVAVTVALLASTMTVFLPLLATAMAATAFLSLALGAEVLQLAHGLEPRAFRDGFALAFLVLLGAGSWQAVVSVLALFGRQAGKPPPKLDPVSDTEGEPAALQSSSDPSVRKGSSAVKELVTPWASFGWLLLFLDLVFVRRDVQGRLDLPDGWVAAAILATMGYAVATVCIYGLRALVTGGWTLWGQARQSQFRAGVIAAAGFLFAVAGALTLLSFYAVGKAHLERNPVVISLHESPTASSSPEELRLMLAQIAAPSQRLSAASTVPGLGPGSGSAGKFPIGSKPFAKCIDTFLDKTSDRDFVLYWSVDLARRFGLSVFDAKGLVLDTLLSVCRQKADDLGDLSGYFQRSLTNAARNYYRRLRRGQSRQCEFEQVYVLATGEADDPERDLELQVNVRQAFCRLRQRDRGLIQARIGENLSFRDIGDEEGMSADTARVAFNRAMERLCQESEKN